MSNHKALPGDRLQRVAVLFLTSILVLSIASCGGSGSSTTPPSQAKNRAFITNTFTGNLQVVDSQNDTTPLTAQTTNSLGQLVPGQPVTIAVSTSATFEVLSPDGTKTLIYNPNSFVLSLLDNSTEAVTTEFAVGNSTGMALFSPDSSKVYVPAPNVPLSGGRSGIVETWDVASSTDVTNYAVASARYIALSPNGQFLLVFSDNSDSLVLIDLNASTTTYVGIPGFARPINAFFGGDSNTAYVLNCGPECGSSGAASVARLDIPSRTITASVTVGGASVGMLNGSTLYVAGSPVPPGTSSTFDAVDISSMKRLTGKSVPIGDGFHTTMALNNNKLYIGANTCLNTTTGCLSVVNVSNNTADPPFPPNGAVTGMQSIPNRNVMYVIEGGVLNIYDTTTDTLQPTQLSFSGALYDVLQIDQ